MELFQVGGFVLFALATEEVGVVFGDVGALAGAARDLERQRGEVRALDVVVEVGGGENEATVCSLHHCISISAMAKAMTLHRGQQTQIEVLRSRMAPPARPGSRGMSRLMPVILTSIRDREGHGAGACGRLPRSVPACYALRRDDRRTRWRRITPARARRASFASRAPGNTAATSGSRVTTMLPLA